VVAADCLLLRQHWQAVPVAVVVVQGEQAHPAILLM